MRKRYKGARRSIGCLIPLLVVLCVLAAGALYFINDNMVFTKEGAIFSPNSGKEEVPPPDTEVNANLIIEEPEPPKVEPSEPLRDARGTVRSAFITRAEVMEEEKLGAIIDSLPSGINTLVFEVKSDDGFLAFVEDSKLAKTAEVSAESDDALRAAIEKARAKGFSVSLYASCFKDNEAARKNQPHSARTENRIIWLDANNTRWLSPYSEVARGYIKDIVLSLAEFSPDEIILSNISFPAEGKTEIISYGEETSPKADVLSSFIADISAAVPQEIMLSSVYENYTGNALVSAGQSLAMFAGKFSRLYINAAGGKSFGGFSEEMKAELSEKSQKYCTIVGWNAASDGEYMMRRAENKLLPPPEK